MPEMQGIDWLVMKSERELDVSTCTYIYRVCVEPLKVVAERVSRAEGLALV
jgi:hypothetical protein